jgi:hypothetical protein
VLALARFSFLAIAMYPGLSNGFRAMSSATVLALLKLVLAAFCRAGGMSGFVGI